jgi:hypothetical protein
VRCLTTIGLVLLDRHCSDRVAGPGGIRSGRRVFERHRMVDNPSRRCWNIRAEPSDSVAQDARLALQSGRDRWQRLGSARIHVQHRHSDRVGRQCALIWTFDLTAKTISILDQSFSLADVNVVLVDDADCPQGSRGVRALRDRLKVSGRAVAF